MAPPSDEIMTAVTKPEAVSMAEIHAIRQMTDAVGTLTRQVERMNSKVDDVRERVIRLEAREYERQIDDLSARLTAALVRIDGLESTRDKQTGAAGLAAWLTKNAPWLVAIFMAGLAAFGWKEGSPGQ